MQELRVAFVPGATPDKWARVWRDRHPRIPIRLIPIEQSDQRAVLDAGEADLVIGRLPADLDRPTPLHCVRLYDELPVVVAGTDHFVAAADEQAVIDPADLADEQLALPEASGWSPSAEQLPFPLMTAKDAVEVAASGSAVLILPMALARLHHRKDVVSRVVDLPPTTIALLWLRDADSEVHQDFVGVTRGRGARSSR
ncbi:LysR family transcriptional regulator substrate-binding protein [Nocardioides caeni]|uniref:LysR family transcriptional regulator n=1 Tax=Nocardioides caeni TaxID=574700 RepID=A0A4S8MZN3_9ACTN|nr:LysR family transcriptional regulator substrate-binding protein [Nocardioides caeni]THV08805.1 LysR family transcriptional regulator [Nocardioides caeni]